MKNLIIVSICLSSLFGCSSLPESTNELQKRSILDHKIQAPKHIPAKKYQSIEKVYVGGRFLQTGDWFHGSWVSLVVEDRDYIFDDPILKKLNSRK
ncbi:MAG: hypothetical protein KDD45_00615 [Bdellovibrionales bacterium]|nr:hypothetical protein [Bdellovibrionales bacterium]